MAAEDHIGYDSSDIQSLGDLEAIRMRPGMYIGDTSNPQQLFIEALDNAVDEVQSGHSDRAVVCVDTGRNLYSVRDYGRGIPHGKSVYRDLLGEDVEIETLQLVYTKSHSGGKFGDGAYKKSRGLHGIGLKAINALSSHARAVTFRDGRFVELTMSRGDVLGLRYGKVGEDPVDVPQDVLPAAAEPDGPGGDSGGGVPDVQEGVGGAAQVGDRVGADGTYVEFVPDPDVFEDPRVPVGSILELSGISKAFGSDVEVWVDGEPTPLPYSELYDLLPEVGDGESVYLTETFRVEGPTSESIVAALRYTSETNALYRGYTNTIYNSSGGSHVRFFESCYKEAWSDRMTPDFRPEDVLVGLRALVGVFIGNESMAFAGQTKERLTTRVAYFEQFREGLVSGIRAYLDANPEVYKGLVRRFSEYRRNLDRMRADRELKDTVIVNDSTDPDRVRRRSVVTKLRECTSRSREGTRLFITEGDSAGGAVLQARNVRTDAVLPIRGKILNVSNLDPEKALRNEEVRSIVNAAGTGIGEWCDAARSRYGGYYLCCDADADGLNIAALLASIFVNLLPGLVRSGVVYAVQPPLYSWNDHGTIRYTSDLSEVGDRRGMSRFKGLGEMDPEDLRETVLSDENQRLVRISYPDSLDAFNEAMTSSKLRFDMLCDAGYVVGA